MIQRIQSIWLFLSAVVIAGTFFFPFAEITSGNLLFVLKYRGIFEETSHGEIIRNTAYLLAGILTLILISTLITVFIFKNRILQMKICLIISLLIIVSSALIIYFSTCVVEKSHIEYSVASGFPILAFILILLARRSIKKDEELVRSTDRIR
jgi:hypothetical protein